MRRLHAVGVAFDAELLQPLFKHVRLLDWNVGIFDCTPDYCRWEGRRQLIGDDKVGGVGRVLARKEAIQGSGHGGRLDPELAWCSRRRLGEDVGKVWFGDTDGLLVDWLDLGVGRRISLVLEVLAWIRRVVVGVHEGI